jgi:hypothetical protein
MRRDIAATVGDHHGVDARRSRRPPPVGDEGVAYLAPRRAGDESPALAVLRRPSVDLTGTQCGQRVAIPLARLPARLVQLDRADPFGDATERAAGVDLRQLPIVADEDELGAGLLGV